MPRAASQDTVKFGDDDLDSHNESLEKEVNSTYHCNVDRIVCRCLMYCFNAQKPVLSVSLVKSINRCVSNFFLLYLVCTELLA